MKNIISITLILMAALFSIPSVAGAELKIPVGASITVYWRTVPAKTNLFKNTGKFDSSADIKAVKSPFGDGGITGESIISSIKTKKLKGKIVEYRALIFTGDSDPAVRTPRASIVIKDDDSLYDNYVMQMGNKSLAVYVIVFVE